MPIVNPLFARLETKRHATGLWSATVDCDHGLHERTRVHHSLGWLSEHDARIAGKRIAARLGRALIAATVAALVILPGAESRASDARSGLQLIVANDGAEWRCASPAECSAMVRAFGCRYLAHDGAAVLVECTESKYRHAKARHSA